MATSLEKIFGGVIAIILFREFMTLLGGAAAWLLAEGATSGDAGGRVSS